jgi:hypothetical protein
MGATLKFSKSNFKFGFDRGTGPLGDHMKESNSDPFALPFASVTVAGAPGERCSGLLSGHSGRTCRSVLGREDLIRNR